MSHQGGCEKLDLQIKWREKAQNIGEGNLSGSDPVGQC
jgi:hypothetical protein